jgi:hypothetical protein
LLVFNLGAQSFSDGDKVLGPKKEEAHQDDSGDALTLTNVS